MHQMVAAVEQGIGRYTYDMRIRISGTVVGDKIDIVSGEALDGISFIYLRGLILLRYIYNVSDKVSVDKTADSGMNTIQRL